MKVHLAAATMTITLVLLAAVPGQGQDVPAGKGEFRDFAALMPGNAWAYVEMNHANAVKKLLALIKASALDDYAAFRDDLYKKLKVETTGGGFFGNANSSAWWAFVLTPEFLNEIGRMKGHAVAVTGFKESRFGPEPEFLWVVDPGTSNILPLIARDVLTLVPSMKTVRTVEGVRLYQNHHKWSVEDKEKNGADKGGKDKEKGKIVAEGPVLAVMPGLIVLGSDVDMVADAVLRAKNKKASKPALTQNAEFKQTAALRDKKQMFGYVNLQQMFGKKGPLEYLAKNPAGFGTFFGWDTEVLILAELLGPESAQGLAAAFWLEENSPNLQLAVTTDAKQPGPLATLLASQQVDPQALQFAPESTFATVSVPLFKEPGDWNKLLTDMKRIGNKYKLPPNLMFDVVEQVNRALDNPKGKKALTNVASMTLALVMAGEEGLAPLLILDAKDADAAEAVEKLIPELIGKDGTAGKTMKVGKQTISFLSPEQNRLAAPVYYGRQGTALVFGPGSTLVANSLQAGADGKGFAARPDVAKTLGQVKDVNGLVLWSGSNILNGMVQAEEALFKKLAKKIDPKKGADSQTAADLLRVYPGQLKKIAGDVQKVAKELPAGSLTLTAKTDRVTITGSQQGLKDLAPQLINALVEWDLTRPPMWALQGE